MEWLSSLLQSVSKPFRWWLVVAAWEQGVRVRLGKSTKLLNPGIHLRIPFLDRVFVQSTRMRVVYCQGQSISTKTGEIITFGIGLRYQIKDIVKLFHTLASVEGVLLYESVSRISHLIATSNLKDLSPAIIEAKINKEMPSEEYGLEAVQVSIMNFCIARCYRFITGDPWIPTGPSYDEKDTSGEV